MDNEFIFDPKILIRPPYFDCPKCKEKGCFGVLSVYSEHYTRRCKECWYDESYPLPRLKKSIIYIDQFAISNMMKSLNPKIPIDDKNNDFFRQLFLKLEFLAKAHIVVCPDSSIHYDESIMSRHYEDIKSMYKYLSFGTSYMPASTINRFHFVSAFEKYIMDKDDIAISRKTVCSGYNDWKERYRIDIISNSEEDDKKQIKKTKLKIQDSLQSVFELWKNKKPFVFNEVFMRELNAPAELYINHYLAHQGELIKAYAGLEFNKEIFNPDETIVIMHQLLDILKANGGGVDMEKDLKNINAFLCSDKLLEIPNHRIECLLWAAIARTASFGQNKFKISIVNDIKAISSYMPYSDAIFIDKECYHLLNDVDVQKRLKCDTRVFSLANKEDFLKYLDDLIAKVSPERISVINNVYGEQWMKPYTSMYE